MFTLRRAVAICKSLKHLNYNVITKRYSYNSLNRISIQLPSNERFRIHKISVFKFHTSQPNRAIPPLLWIVVRPLLKLCAILFGRGIRKWWQKLPKNKKMYFLEVFRRKKFSILGSVAALNCASLSYYYYHLEEHPLTKRKRFNIFTNDQVIKVAVLQSTMLLELHRNDIVQPVSSYFTRVHGVVSRLLFGNVDIEEMKNTEWSITVIYDNTPNAFVFPNGHIFVFTGMLDECKNDDQLGIILGHEMAHAILGHSSEQLSNSRIIEMLFLIPLVLLWTLFPDSIALFYQVFSTYFISVVLELPYSRNIEREADIVGLQLAAKSCFDVREAVTFWKRMSELDPLNKHSEFISSHPSHENRKQVLEEIIPQAIDLRRVCKCPDLK